MIKKQLSRAQIRAIGIRRRIEREKAQAAQGMLPGIVTETPATEKPMHPRLLKMCVEAAGIGQDESADAA